MVLLRERLGKEVVREARYVDITVEHGARKMLVEIKTYPSAKHAIRKCPGPDPRVCILLARGEGSADSIGQLGPRHYWPWSTR